MIITSMRKLRYAGIFFCGLLVFIASGDVCAQKRNKDALLPGTKLLRINFTGMVDPLETNLSAGLEYKKTEQLSFTTDLGYVFYSGIMGNVKSTNGIIFRTAARVYSRSTPQFFGAMELHHKLVFYGMHDWLSMNNVNGVSGYEELKDFTYTKYVGGLSFKTGYQGRITRDQRWLLEAYLGFGLKYRNYFLTGQPAGTQYTNVNNGFFWGNNRTAGNGGIVLPNFSMGLRILYNLSVPPNKS